MDAVVAKIKSPPTVTLAPNRAMCAVVYYSRIQINQIHGYRDAQ